MIVGKEAASFARCVPRTTIATGGTPLDNAIKARFRIHESVMPAWFGVQQVRLLPVGSFTAKLRFGFSQADADTSTRGINFNTLSLPQDSDWAGVRFDPGLFALPHAPGADAGILPPFVTVLITAPAVTNIIFEIYAGFCFQT